MKDGNHTILKKKKSSLFFLAGLFIGSAALFAASTLLEGELVHLNDQLPFITLHNMMELASVIISCSIFFISYFTYEQTKSIRLLIIGVIFLQIGFLDMFHLLSGAGMPDFITSNGNPGKENSFWILGRLATALGMLAFAWIPEKKHTYTQRGMIGLNLQGLEKYPAAGRNCNKNIVLLAALIFTALLSAFAFACPGTLSQMYEFRGGFTLGHRLVSIVITLLFIGVAVVYAVIYTRTGNRLFFLLAEAGVLNVFSDFAYAVSPHIFDTYSYLAHLYKIAAFILVFRVLFIFTIQNPYIRLSRSEKRARFYAERLDQVVENRVKQIKNANTALLRDLAYAQNIYQAMLPKEMHFNDKIQLRARYFPAKQLGGNFYSLFKINEDETGILLVKSSIFGTGSAMLTVFIHQSFQLIQDINRRDGLDTSPAAVLRQLRKFVAEADFGREIGIGLLYAAYHARRDELTYAATGWEAREILPCRELDTLLFCLDTMVINHSVSTPDQDLKNMVIKLHPGDNVLFASGNPLTYGIKHSLLPEKGVYREKPAPVLSAAIQLLDFEGDCSSISEDLALLWMRVESGNTAAGDGSGSGETAVPFCRAETGI